MDEIVWESDIRPTFIEHTILARLTGLTAHIPKSEQSDSIGMWNKIQRHEQFDIKSLWAKFESALLHFWVIAVFDLIKTE